MIFDKHIQTLFEKGDLEALKALNTPLQRKQNPTQHYHSLLMLSAHNIKHLNKISSLEADGVILNLEDGVSPTLKPFALELCAYALRGLKVCNKKLIVRVNPLDEGGLEEIIYLNNFYPDAIRVAKIRTKEEVVTILQHLDESIELHLSIETKEAWLNLASLAHPRVKAFYLGILDLFADLHLSQALLHVENESVNYILSHFLITSKALGIKPVSFVYQNYQDDEGFLRWLKKERAMGYDAKGCLSPSQVKQVNTLFNINKYELTKAQEIVALFEAKAKEGITGFSHEKYGFIDEPIYKDALNTVEQGVR